MSNGKGSRPRPLSISKDDFDARWALAFGKKLPAKQLGLRPVKREDNARNGTRRPN